MTTNLRTQLEALRERMLQEVQDWEIEATHGGTRGARAIGEASSRVLVRWVGAINTILSAPTEAQEVEGWVRKDAEYEDEIRFISATPTALGLWVPARLSIRKGEK